MPPFKRINGFVILMTLLASVYATVEVHEAAASTAGLLAGNQVNNAIESGKAQALTEAVDAAAAAHAQVTAAGGTEVIESATRGAAALENIVRTTGLLVDSITAQAGALSDGIYARGMAEIDALTQQVGKQIVAASDLATSSIASEVASGLESIEQVAEETACDIQGIVARAFSIINMNIAASAAAAKYGATINGAVEVGATRNAALTAQHAMNSLAAGLAGMAKKSSSVH